MNIVMWGSVNEEGREEEENGLYSLNGEELHNFFTKASFSFKNEKSPTKHISIKQVFLYF